MIENQILEKKSLRTITKSNPDWDEIAKDCVGLANASGGKLIFGIEDSEELPPDTQKVPEGLVLKLQKTIQSLTINVSIIPQIIIALNGAEYIELKVQRNANAIAGTSKGKYYIRIGKDCRPVLPDELERLMGEKNAFTWETKQYLKINKSDCDEHKLKQFINDVRESERVSSFIKEKSNDELLFHYFFIEDNNLTNLGILWIGKREHRARLLYAPTIQFIKYNENEQKINKLLWDDFALNPKELIQSVWDQVLDFRDSIEFPDGLFRKNIFDYDEVVIRELLANALVHRSYTIRGDIFINLYPDRLEIHNPGLLPLGVSPSNILHQSVQRNYHLAKVFYDLKLMEKEGSGYDKIYEILLASGKPLSITVEGNDRVSVTIKKRIVNTDIINFIDKANSEVQLRTKELICLGLIAQHNSLSAMELSKILGLESEDIMHDWIGRLQSFGFLKSKGKTKGTSYFIDPELLKRLNFKGQTNLKKIDPIRLRELVKEVLITHGECSKGDIHTRIGKEIPERFLRSQLRNMVDSGIIKKSGLKRGVKYFIDDASK